MQQHRNMKQVKQDSGKQKIPEHSNLHDGKRASSASADPTVSTLSSKALRLAAREACLEGGLERPKSFC